MMFDLSWALMRRRPHRKLEWLFFEAVDLQGKVGNKLFQIVVLPLEVFDLLTGGVSHRVPGETLFPRFHELYELYELHELLGPGIENAWLDPLSSAEVTNGHFSSEPFQDDAALTCRMKVLVS